MIGRRGVMGLLGVAGMALLGGCSLFRRRWKYRYRLTAEISRNGETYTASSVIEVVRTQAYAAILGEARGEAVAVDIPRAGCLFLLLRGEPGDAAWTYAMPHHAFESQLGSVAMVDPALLDKLEQLQGVKVELAPKLYPLMVRFRDTNDPTTVELVDPSDLARSFGLGVKLKRVTVEITDDPVTTGIEKRLGWLGNIKGKFSSSQFPADLHLGNFSGMFSTEFK